jgi:hypothetical protein
MGAIAITEPPRLHLANLIAKHPISVIAKATEGKIII